MNLLHSDYCHCACDLLAQRLVEIIATMKSNNGSHALWILQLENLLDDYDV
jgi:hypothetical protein